MSIITTCATEPAPYLRIYVGAIRRLGGIPAFKICKDWHFGNELILFIDDEDILAAMGQALLERLGYRVTVRRNSIEALSTFQNHPDQFDLVITDQTMPGMMGSDLARRLMGKISDLLLAKWMQKSELN